MSLCFRTISSKIPTSVGTRKQITQLDRGFQNVLQTKLNGTSLLTKKNRALNICGTAISPFRTEAHKYFEDGIAGLNIKNLKDSHFDRDYKTKIITLSQCYLNYANSFHHRNMFRILNSNDLESRCSFSTQSNVQLKRKVANPFGSSMSDDLNNNNLSNKKSGVDPREGRPSIEQIEKVKQNLTYNLPLFFVQLMDYSIYSKDLIFVNNIKGTTTTGFIMYYLQSSLLKIYGHMKFMYVKFNVLKITANPEDDSVKVRWRITGISGMKIFTKFTKLKPLRVQESIQREQETWHDGFSTFYIDKNGKVYKHVLDKIMPDSDSIEDKKSIKIPVKLAIALGISNLDFLLSEIATKV